MKKDFKQFRKTVDQQSDEQNPGNGNDAGNDSSANGSAQAKQAPAENKPAEKAQLTGFETSTSTGKNEESLEDAQKNGQDQS